MNEVLAEANAARYVFYSWSLEPELIETWKRFGVVGFLDKRLTAEELADALERIHGGESGVASVDYPAVGRRRLWATGPAVTTGSAPARQRSSR